MSTKKLINFNVQNAMDSISKMSDKFYAISNQLNSADKIETIPLDAYYSDIDPNRVLSLMDITNKMLTQVLTELYNLNSSVFELNARQNIPYTGLNYNEAFAKDNSFYAAWDDEFGEWGVFGDSTGFCYSQPIDCLTAEKIAENMNIKKNPNSCYFNAETTGNDYQAPNCKILNYHTDNCRYANKAAKFSQ